MASYITTLNLMQNAQAADASEEAVWAEYAEGASRLFDKLADVEDGFFAKAESAASVKTFYGNGIDMMELPPFVENSVSGITIDDEDFDSEDWRVTRGGFLVRLDDGEFDESEVIEITARWGFAEIPADVKLIVNELAVYLWRNRDPMFARMSDVEIEANLSPTVNAAIKKYRDKYGTSAQ